MIFDLGKGRSFDQVRFAQWLHDSVLKFGLLEAFLGLSVDRHLHLSRHVGEIGDGVPRRELVPDSIADRRQKTHGLEAHATTYQPNFTDGVRLIP